MNISLFVEASWKAVPTLPTNWVTVDKPSFFLSRLKSPHLYNKDSNNSYLTGLQWALVSVHYWECFICTSSLRHISTNIIIIVVVVIINMRKTLHRCNLAIFYILMAGKSLWSSPITVWLKNFLWCPSILILIFKNLQSLFQIYHYKLNSTLLSMYPVQWLGFEEFQF